MSEHTAPHLAAPSILDPSRIPSDPEALRRFVEAMLTEEDVTAYWEGEPTENLTRVLDACGITGFQASLAPVVVGGERVGYRPVIRAVYPKEPAVSPETLEHFVRYDPGLLTLLGYWYDGAGYSRPQHEALPPQRNALRAIFDVLSTSEVWEGRGSDEERTALGILSRLREVLDDAGMHLLSDWITYLVRGRPGFGGRQADESDLGYLERQFGCFRIRFDALAHEDPEDLPGLASLFEQPGLTARQKAEILIAQEPRAAACFEWLFYRGPHPDVTGRYYCRDDSDLICGDYGFAVFDRETGEEICSSKWARWCASMAETFSAFPDLVDEYRRIQAEYDIYQREMCWQDAEARFDAAFRALGHPIREWRLANPVLSFYDPFEPERTRPALRPGEALSLPGGDADLESLAF